MQDIPRLKADFFKALGHPLRIRALELLEHLDVEQPQLSQQLGPDTPARLSGGGPGGG